MTQLKFAKFFDLKNARKIMIKPGWPYFDVYVDGQKMIRCGAGVFTATENVEGIIVNGSRLPIHHSLH
jgi:hypothetical protein